jgi:hypothetical protein
MALVLGYDDGFGLDVIALVGRLCHAGHRSVPEIHAESIRRGVVIYVRGVGNCTRTDGQYHLFVAVLVHWPANPVRFGHSQVVGGARVPLPGKPDRISRLVYWIVQRRIVLGG